MCYKRLPLWLFFISCYCGTGLANNQTPWEITLSGGSAQLNAQDFTTNLYPNQTPDDKNQQQNAGEWKAWTVHAGIGYRFFLGDAKNSSQDIQWLPLFIPQLNFYYLQGNIEGRVDKYYEYPIDPNCDVGYSTRVSSSRLMADTNLTLISWHRYSLYAKAGVGLAWNQVDYHSTDGPYSQTLSLAQQTDTNFAYEFGGGARVDINPYVGFSVEYLYTGVMQLELNNKGALADVGEIGDMESEPFNLSSQAILLGVYVVF